MPPADKQPGLITSKLFQPILMQNRVVRKDLLQRLNDGLQNNRPFTLISAPAGYGKTTLVVEWIAQVGRPTAWVSLDATDDEPVRFFQYFLAGLRRIGADFGPELDRALASGQLPPQDVFIAALVNAFAVMEIGGICILDDFHCIEDKAILSILTSLLSHMPPQVHLALVTREDPALPLARLRARNQMTEVRTSDLRFSNEEINQFLHTVMGLSLSDQDILRLEERTEGWVAGLQLAGLSMQGRSNPSEFIATLSGSHRFILGYLTEEVLRCQPDSVQEFLLCTSILAKINGDLCDYVTEKANSADLLEELLAANLFLIPLDDESHWYRYHHLFADLLRSHLRKTYPDRLVKLHHRASEWYEQHLMPTEAIEQALAGQNFPRAVGLIELHVWDLLNQGYVRMVESWMQSIPEEFRAGSLRANLGFAWMNLLRGNFPMIAPYLQRAQAALDRLDPESAAVKEMRAECLALQANVLQAQGKLTEGQEAANQALKLAPGHNLRLIGLASLALGAVHRQMAHFDEAAAVLQNAINASRETGDVVTEMLAVAHMTLMSIQHGRLNYALEVASQSVEHLERMNLANPPIVGAVYGALGLVYYERDQLELAREFFLRGIRLGTFSGHNASLIYSKVNYARMLQGGGDIPGADNEIRESLALLSAGAPGWVRPDLLARQVQLLLAKDQPDAAEALLRQSGIAPGDAVNHQMDGIHLAWLRLLVYQKSPSADDLARRIMASAEAGKRHGTLIQALILISLRHKDDPSVGVTWLQRAIDLAKPEGYVRIFLDESPQLDNLLRWAGWGSSNTDSEPVVTLHKDDDLIEPLSEREKEVLRLLAEGLKYAEIANHLVVSVNTVRFHVKSIYGKLNVDSQIKAVERARSLGILPVM